MDIVPRFGPPRYRIFYRLSNGQQCFSQAWSDHEFADRWCKLIKLSPGVVFAQVLAVEPEPVRCPWCGQVKLALDLANAVCVDCDRFVPAADLSPALRAC
jgi:hypothetical protein